MGKTWKYIIIIHYVKCLGNGTYSEIMNYPLGNSWFCHDKWLCLWFILEKLSYIIWEHVNILLLGIWREISTILLCVYILYIYNQCTIFLSLVLGVITNMHLTKAMLYYSLNLTSDILSITNIQTYTNSKYSIYIIIEIIDYYLLNDLYILFGNSL